MIFAGRRIFDKEALVARLASGDFHYQEDQEAVQIGIRITTHAAGSVGKSC